jgi:hypothetical protein
MLANTKENTEFLASLGTTTAENQETAIHNMPMTLPQHIAPTPDKPGAYLEPEDARSSYSNRIQQIEVKQIISSDCSLSDNMTAKLDIMKTPSPNVPIAPVFAFQELPNQIRLEIISYLHQSDLYTMAQLSRNELYLVKGALDTHYKQPLNKPLWLITETVKQSSIEGSYFANDLLKCYQKILYNTPLWRYLHHIAGIVKQPSIVGYLHYFANDTSINIQTPQWPIFWQSAIKLQLPRTLSSLAEVDESFVTKQAMWIINQVEYYGETSLPGSSINYLRLPKAPYSQQLRIWEGYQKLEAIFATMVLYSYLDFVSKEKKDVDVACVLLKPHFSHWLNGADLIILDQTYPGILAKLIQRALNLSKMNLALLVQEKLRIQELLNRLTEQNILDYLGQDDGQIKERRVVFLQAIQDNYLPLLQKFTDAVLMKMILNEYDDEPAYLISSHPFLIKQLSAKHLIKDFLGILNEKQFENVLQQNLEVSRYLTFELAKGLLNTAYYIDKIRLLLLQADFLHRLTHEQVIELAHKIISGDFEIVINSEVFLKYVIRLDRSHVEKNLFLENQEKILQHDNQPSYLPIQHPVNEFLISLATPPKEDKTTIISAGLTDAPVIIAKHSTLVSLLTVDELFELNKLSRNDISVPLALIQNDAVIYRLKEVGRLVEMTIKHPIVGEDFAKRRLYLLSAEELRQFVAYYQTPSKYFNPSNWFGCQDKLTDIHWLILAASLSYFTAIIKKEYSDQPAHAADRYLERLKGETASVLPIETLRENEIQQLSQQFGEKPAIKSLVEAIIKPFMALQITKDKSSKTLENVLGEFEETPDDLSESSEAFTLQEVVSVGTVEELHDENQNSSHNGDSDEEDIQTVREEDPSSETLISTLAVADSSSETATESENNPTAIPEITPTNNEVNHKEENEREETSYLPKDKKTSSNDSDTTSTLTNHFALEGLKIASLVTLALIGAALVIGSILSIAVIPFTIPFIVAACIEAIGGLACLTIACATVTKYFVNTKTSSPLQQATVPQTYHSFDETRNSTSPNRPFYYNSIIGSNRFLSRPTSNSRQMPTDHLCSNSSPSFSPSNPSCGNK